MGKYTWKRIANKRLSTQEFKTLTTVQKTLNNTSYHTFKSTREIDPYLLHPNNFDTDEMPILNTILRLRSQTIGQATDEHRGTLPPLCTKCSSTDISLTHLLYECTHTRSMESYTHLTEAIEQTLGPNPYSIYKALHNRDKLTKTLSMTLTDDPNTNLTMIKLLAMLTRELSPDIDKTQKLREPDTH